MSLKEIWIDCETTGLDPKKNALIQVCVEIYVDGIIKDEFDIFMNPGVREINSEALKVIGKTQEEIMTYKHSEMAYRQFLNVVDRFIDKWDKTDKFIWYGYNPQFDMDFMREWFSLNGNKYFGGYFWTPPIDVRMLSVYAQKEYRRDMIDTKLWTMAKWYGVNLSKFLAHDAKDDIRVTQELYKKITLNKTAQ